MACKHSKPGHNDDMDRPAIPDSDPMPQPPEQPELEACCGSGCDPCIFDAYDLAMDEYRQALRAWRARHSESHDQNP